MMILSVGRFEGSYALCEDKNRKMYAIEIQEMPVGAKVGDMITISEDGEINIDSVRTAAAKKKIRGLEDKLWQ